LDQVIQAGALLYSITGDEKYLTEAKQIALRGFIELYKIDGISTYVDAYREMLLQGWYSTCRNKTYNILNYQSFRGGVSQSKKVIKDESFSNCDL
jgi:hypothetical protein